MVSIFLFILILITDADVLLQFIFQTVTKHDWYDDKL